MPTVNVDRIGQMLAEGARLGRQMPPSWDGARIAPLLSGPDGEYFGRMLPGRGLYLAHDLKDLGITRPIAGVYERSPLMRTVEAMDQFGQTRGHLFCAERMAVRLLDTLRVMTGRLVPACAITNYDGIIASRAGGFANDFAASKGSFTTVASGWASTFRAGGTPGVGTYSNIPGGAAPNRTNVGALTLGLSNPTGANKKYLLTIGVGVGANMFWVILADLVMAAGNILATTAAAQTVNTAALTRYTTGAGVCMTFEITTQLSATAHNITVNKYTSQAGATLHTTGAQTSLNAGIVQRLTPTDYGPFMGLAAGDYGVQSVQEVTFSAALAAGVVALNLYYPLAFLPGAGSGMYLERDSTIQIDGLTELVVGSDSQLGCLTLYLLPNTTSVGNTQAFLRATEG